MSSPPIQVLLIEDNPGDARLLQEMLKESSSFKTELTQFSNMADGLSHLARNAANVVLLDLGLPDANGLAAVRKVHEVAAWIALVVLTGLDDETVATQALTEGAQDYLIKGQIGTQALLRAIRYAIERQRMRVETDEVRKLQLQLRNDFVSMVSHELRTPLTSIRGAFCTISRMSGSSSTYKTDRNGVAFIIASRGWSGPVLDVPAETEARLRGYGRFPCWHRDSDRRVAAAIQCCIPRDWHRSSVRWLQC
jgi:DNA-binding NarL/FixJ family response regulator